jgi:hypothetical protein
LFQRALKEQQVRIAILQAELDDRNVQLLEKTSGFDASQLQLAKLKQTIEYNEVLKQENRRSYISIRKS